MDMSRTPIHIPKIIKSFNEPRKRSYFHTAIDTTGWAVEAHIQTSNLSTTTSFRANLEVAAF